MEAAARGEQQSARVQQPHRAHVDVLVAANGGLQSCARLREGRWIQYDRIEAIARPLTRLEKVENVCLQHVDIREAVSFGVLPGAFERRSRRINRKDAIRTAREVERERTVVAEAVERA